MNLLTWHGTIVRIDGATKTLVHVPLWPISPDDEDLTLALPSKILTGRAVAANLSNLMLEPAGRPGTVHFSRDGKFLCAELQQAALQLNRDQPREWESFLLLLPEETENLRYILANSWISEPSGKRVPRGAIQLGENFTMKFSAVFLDLVTRQPVCADPKPAEGGGELPGGLRPRELFLLPPATPGGPAFLIRRAPDTMVAETILLHDLPPFRLPAPVGSREAFLAASDRSLKLPGATEYVMPPMFVSSADPAMFVEKYWNAKAPPLGRRQEHCVVRRESNKHVVLQRLAEGTIFDADGVSNERGFVENLGPAMWPPGLTVENGMASLRSTALEGAPEVPGRHMVFYNGNLQNYYHWLVDAMLTLDILAREAPADTGLLLPGTIARLRGKAGGGFDHRNILNLLGFGDIPVTEIDAPYCRVEEVVWLDRYYIEELPASFVQRFRDRMLERTGRGQNRHNRIYIRRAQSRRVANAEMVEAFVMQHGFSVYNLEEMAPVDQIALFQGAEYIIAPHGAGLANLLFCPPGVRVIELTPDSEFRPFFWLIGSKLGLTYGVLPCATEDGLFSGKQIVDVGKLRAMLRMVEARVD